MTKDEMPDSMTETRDLIADLRQKCHALENRLSKAIAPLLREFQDGTGVAIRSVDVQMIDSTPLDGPQHRILGRVVVEIELKR